MREFIDVMVKKGKRENINLTTEQNVTSFTYITLFFLLIKITIKGLNNNIENGILAIFKDQSDTFIERGNISIWEEYRVINLLSVTTRFAV